MVIVSLSAVCACCAIRLRSQVVAQLEIQCKVQLLFNVYELNYSEPLCKHSIVFECDGGRALAKPQVAVIFFFTTRTCSLFSYTE